jgi:excisionase family DNA binding protein
VSFSYNEHTTIERSTALGRAAKAAITRAKRHGRPEVTKDDLFVGLLEAVARFGIVPVGPWTIDLDALIDLEAQEADAVGSTQSQGDAEPKNPADVSAPKVAYSAGAAAMFDRAAAVARRDKAERVEAVHMLVAFAPDDEGIMGRLKSTYGITATAWRAALIDWEPPMRRRSAPGSGPLGPSDSPEANGRTHELRDKLLLSPDEAAELLGVHTQTVRGYIRDGKLKARRVAGERAIRIRREDLLALLEPYDQDS